MYVGLGPTEPLLLLTSSYASAMFNVYVTFRTSAAPNTRDVLKAAAAMSLSDAIPLPKAEAETKKAPYAVTAPAAV